MSFPNRVIFQQFQSQVGRPPVNDDYISGLNFYLPAGRTLPSGFASSQTVPFLSLTQAENAGIVDDYSDETQASATYTVSTLGTTGSTVITITVGLPLGNTAQLCSYTQQSGDTSAIILATSITAAINANTINTGFVATQDEVSDALVASITITAAPGLGLYLNSSKLTATYTNQGTYTDSITDFSGGVPSVLAVWHYHISEYFRLMPNGKVFVTITPYFSITLTYAVGDYTIYEGQWYRCTTAVITAGSWDSADWTSATTFSDILAAQAFAQGNIRQFGVYIDGHVFATADIIAAKLIKNQLFTNNQPAEIWLGVDISSIADVGGSPGLTDLSGLNVDGTGCSGIGVVVGQDGAAVGANLFYAYGHSITTLGATLGATSNAAVNIDIGWVQQYNITNGTELNVPAFANGQLYSAVFSNENNALTQIDNYRYCFIMNYSGQVGTYFNDDKTATSSTDSFANMNDNRTIDKVQRVVYANLLPLVNGPIDLNADGTIPPLTLANLDSLARNPMEQMARNGEIAGDANGNLAATAVQIDPNQNVVANNGITITVQPTENGTARQILVPIGYAN